MTAHDHKAVSLTAEKFAELERLLSLATPGPWQQDHRKGADGGYRTQVFDAAGDEIATLAWHAKPPRYEGGQKITSTDRAENAELIVAMHEALPYFLSLAKRVAGAPVACHRTYTGKADQTKWSWIDGPAPLGAIDQARLHGWRIENAYVVEIVGGEE